MKKELRELRKEKVKPVSRMRKADIASELEKLRGTRDETPPVASTVGPVPKKMNGKVADVKKAKEHEFPVAPTEAPKKKATVVGGGGAVGAKPKISKSMLRSMLEDLTSSDEE